LLHVSLLGEQAITDDRTGRARSASSRALALIGFLAWRAGSPQPRPRIAGLFWPDSTDAQALTNLRRELHHLRALLGDGDRSPLVVTARDLCWRDTAACRADVCTFGTERAAALAAAQAGDSEAAAASAARAIAVYRGELLPGAYDDWLLEARTELERQCADLCDLLGEVLTGTGDLDRAVAAARRRVQLLPLEEVGYRRLMDLQAELGDRAGAVSTYHHCASVLERELGVLPGPAIREAFQRLMARARPAPEGRAGPGPAGFVGRSGELGRLRDQWQAAAYRPGLVLVRGGAGVGKTRLVAEAAAVAARAGAVAVSAQCFSGSGRLVLTPVADWLRHPAIQAAAAGLDPAWRAELGRLVPSAAHRDPGGLESAWQRNRFFEGLARALLAVGRPLWLTLDNLQWCDQETLEFLLFLLGFDAAAPVLVTATLRDDAAQSDPDLAGWLVRMRAADRLTEVPLGPLGAADTARLAEAVAGRPLGEDEAALVHATTGGFPFYVIEAVRGRLELAGRADPAGPMAPDLRAVLRRRLEQTSDTARQVAGLAAAVGTGFTLDLLAEASDLDADTVVGAVDELWRARIMRELADGYDFSHDLLREAAYAQVSPPQRWLLHRRVAQALALLHPGDADAVAAQLADQYARGGRGDRALDYYARAADVAAGVFAHGEAVRLHQRALLIIRSLPAGRERDRRELAVLESLAAPLNARSGYASVELQETLERSIELAESLGRRDATLAGLVALWTSRFVQGRTADAYRIARRALALAGPGGELNGLGHFAVGGAAISLGMPAEGLRHLDEAVRPASGAVLLSVGTRPDVHATAWGAHAHWLLGQDAEARSACTAAVGLARSIDHPYSLAVALAYGGITQQMLDDPAAVRETAAELRELCDRYDFAYYREWALLLAGWSATDGSGIHLARLGINNLRAAGSFARMPYWLSLLADRLDRDGQPHAARATLDGAIVAGRARDDLWWLPEVMRMRAAHDDPAAAADRLRAAAELAAAHGSAGLLRRCQRDANAPRTPRPLASG
jgi:DNA-binding SARP family transcriptional activator